MSENERKKGLAKKYLVLAKDNVTYIKVKGNKLRKVSEEHLKELDREVCKYESVSLFECFSGSDELVNIVVPVGFNTSGVTNMNGMFERCHSLISVDLSTFDTSRVTDMSRMFEGCSRLTSLDLSTFNTSSVTNMSSMFYGCSSLSSLNLSTFNTSNLQE